MLPKANEWKAKRNKWDGTIDPRYVDELQATADRRKELLRRCKPFIALVGLEITLVDDNEYQKLLDDLESELAMNKDELKKAIEGIDGVFHVYFEAGSPKAYKSGIVSLKAIIYFDTKDNQESGDPDLIDLIDKLAEELADAVGSQDG